MELSETTSMLIIILHYSDTLILHSLSPPPLKAANDYISILTKWKRCIFIFFFDC